MTVTVRDAVGADEDFILALNAACTPAVGAMDANDYHEIQDCAHRVLIAEAGGAPAGFMILIRPGSAYPSLNYAWFEATFSKHLYVDRIAVSAAGRGTGVGRALYDEALRIAAANGDERITCEVNVDPPNPESMAFHTRLGFRHLLDRPWKDKVVAMLVRTLPDAGPSWDWQGTLEAERFVAEVRQWVDENPHADIVALDQIMSEVMTVLWDQCFSQTEIRNAFQKALDHLPAYGGGEERRPNSRYK